MSELLLKRGSKQVWLETLEPPFLFALPFPVGPFACMLWAERGIPAEHRRALCDQLLTSGCRYVVCGGIECEAWHDTADDSYRVIDPTGEASEALVMTTWHEGEPAKDVMFFLLNCTSFGDHNFEHYLILQIGRDLRQAKKLSTLAGKHRFEDDAAQQAHQPAGRRTTIEVE